MRISRKQTRTLPHHYEFQPRINTLKKQKRVKAELQNKTKHTHTQTEILKLRKQLTDIKSSTDGFKNR